MERFERSVVFSTLRPALRLARESDIGVRELQDWVRVGYFKELRNLGLTIAEVAEALGVSEPTANRIAKRLRSDFLVPWEEHELPKRIVLALWQRPRSRARLAQLFPSATRAEIDDALSGLVEEGRIRPVANQDDKFETARAEDRLVGPDAPKRLGALDTLLSSLAELIRRRFFKADSSAFARTVTFRIPQGGGEALQAFYDEQLWPFLAKLEEQAAEEGSSERRQLTIFWTPPGDLENEEGK